MQHFVRWRSRRLIAAAVLAALPSVSPAATFIWSGGDTAHGYFSAADNWAGNAAPPTTGADLIFGVTNTQNSAPFADSPYSLNSITFNSSAYAYTGSHNLEANTLTLTGTNAIIDQAANAEAISNPVLLGGTQTWNVSGTSLSLSNTTLNNTSSSVLTKIGAGTLNLGLSNSSTSSISAFSQTGGTTTLTSGTLTLTTTTTNPLAVTNGTFNVAGGVINAATPGTSFQSVLVDSGGSLLVTGSGSQVLANQIGGQIVLGNTGSNASLTLSNQGAASAVTTFVSAAAGSDSLTINSGGQFTTTFLSVGATSGGSGTVTVTGTGSLATVTSQIALGGYLSAGGTGTLAINSGANVNTAAVTFYTSASSLSINGGSLTTGGLSDIASATGSISLVADPSGGTALNLNGSTGSYTFAGTISGAGSILKSGGSTQILSGNINTSSNATVTGGLLSFTGSGSNLGDLFGSSGNLQVSGGSLTLTSTSEPIGITGGTIAFSNGASITGTAGAFAIGTLPGATGTFSITGGASATSQYGVVGLNTGTVGVATVSGMNSIWTMTTFLSLAGFSGSVGGTGTLTVSNNGAIVAPFTRFQSDLTTLNISGGTLSTGYLLSTGTGFGSIMLADPSGGTALTLNAASGSQTYSGTISGNGTLLKTGGSTQILSGNVNSSGTATVTAGTLVFNGTGNNSIGNLNVQGGAANVSAGILKVNSSAFTVTGGILTVSGATLDASASTNESYVDGPSGTSLVVTGSGTSVILNSNGFAVGVGQTGTLIVSNGAQFLSNVSSKGALSIPFSGSGVLSIASGGIVNFSNVFFDYGLALNGSATVSGAGSAWNVSTMSIGGGASPGVLTVNASGGVYVTGDTVFYDATTAVNISGGTFTCGDLNSSTSGYGLINLIADPTSGTALTINASLENNTYSGAITGAGSILKSGGSTQILSGSDTFTGSVQVTGGVLELTTRNKFSSLVIAGGTAQINGSGNILVVPTLAVITGGTLDLTTDSADISASSLSVITALAQKGFNNGLWTGTGLTSSSAAADTRHLTAIGVIQNNQGGAAIYISTHQFEGVTPGANDVLMKYTYYGDTNLDGKVDGSDYSRIDAAALADRTNPTAMTGWYNGDFNYDGVINGSDYTLIDNAFNTQGAQLSASLAAPAAIPTAEIAPVISATAVPEPTWLTFIPLVVAGCLGRRRNQATT